MLTERKPEMEKAVSSIWQLSEEDKTCGRKRIS